MRAGVDEAGRGPVIGPMVMAGVVCTKEQCEELKDLGVKDSKLLTPQKRDELFTRVQQMRHYVVTLEPADIDAKDKKGLSLNDLEANATIEILQKLDVNEAVVDCPSTNPSAYKEQLQSQLSDMKLLVEHKADTNHIEAAAASIIAKVLRDRAVKQIERDVGQPIGSGYPADPITKEFLAKNWKTHETIFRHSWATYKKVVAKNAQSTLDGF